MAANTEAVYPVTWQDGPIASWLVTVDHKRIGILYIVTAIFFLFAGGIMALLMRAQLATPNEGVLTKDRYDQVMTMHGTVMVFLVVAPIFAYVLYRNYMGKTGVVDYVGSAIIGVWFALAAFDLVSGPRLLNSLYSEAQVYPAPAARQSPHG